MRPGWGAQPPDRFRIRDGQQQDDDIEHDPQNGGWAQSLGEICRSRTSRYCYAVPCHNETEHDAKSMAGVDRGSRLKAHRSTVVQLDATKIR